jgi:flap endonuclease-1
LGIVLTPILKREPSSFKALSGKSFAIDASIELHQFLALIRKRDGTLFTDSHGRVTSHLIGLLTRTSRLITDYYIHPIFVFDGKYNLLKKRTVEARRQAQVKAEAEYKQAIVARDYEKAWSKVVMTGRVTSDILSDAKRLLTLMGVPWLDAYEDAEAQASYMAAKHDVWAVGSKDYDCLLFGAPILARYLTLTGREYLPSKGTSRKLVPELVKLSDNLQLLGITRQQLVDLAILVGTDFNEGIKGIGPKKALQLIRKYDSLEKVPGNLRELLPENVEEVRNIFLHPRVLDKYSVVKGRVDPDGIVSFLSGEREFSADRVRAVADRLRHAEELADSSLGKWLS